MAGPTAAVTVMVAGTAMAAGAVGEAVAKPGIAAAATTVGAADDRFDSEDERRASSSPFFLRLVRAEDASGDDSRSTLAQEMPSMNGLQAQQGHPLSVKIAHAVPG